MKKFHAAKIFALAVLSSALIFSVFSACNKNSAKNSSSKKNADTEEFLPLTLSDATASDLSQNIKKSVLTEKTFLILFGYGFNSDEEKTPILSALKEKYGLDEDGGLIYPLTYPDSFKRGAKGYVSELISILEDKEKDYAGIILLGAPENTHRAFAAHQDFWGEKVPYPAISLFSQDDILGTESTCDIVIDNGKTQSDEMGDEEHLLSSAEVTEIVESIIDYVMVAGTNFNRDTELYAHVQQILGARVFHRYTDPESGLQSINHFVIY